jgi:hypothetical protein
MNMTLAWHFLFSFIDKPFLFFILFVFYRFIVVNERKSCAKISTYRCGEFGKKKNNIRETNG